jgi:hypothetical protein
LRHCSTVQWDFHRSPPEQSLAVTGYSGLVLTGLPSPWFAGSTEQVFETSKGDRRVLFAWRRDCYVLAIAETEATDCRYPIFPEFVVNRDFTVSEIWRF